MGSKSGIVAITMVGLVALAVYSAAGRGGELTSATAASTRNVAGELIRPEGWEAWVMVGASIGLSYAEDGSFEPVMEGSAPGMFHNVYMQPWAYRHFRDTGEFPEGTMFILAMYAASQNADPARGGWYEEDGFLAEIHLKQRDLHESGWGFYGYGGGGESSAMIPGDAACYSCHAEETALDQVFVQFYPALRHMLP